METSESFSIREILPSDNSQILNVIVTVLKSFNAAPATSALGDESIHHMYENYREPRAVYFIAESGDFVYGGCGLRQLAGSSENICELQRMFLLPEARGLGLGKRLLGLCIEKAKEFGYNRIYLESTSMMRTAIKMYSGAGFKRLPSCKGATGHSWCDVFMELNINSGDEKDKE